MTNKKWGMKIPDNPARFDANIRAFSEDHGELCRSLVQCMPQSQLVADENGGHNVDLGGGKRFYPQSAEEAAKQQVAAFLDEPLRFFFAPHDPDDESVALRITADISKNRFLRDIRARMSPLPKASSQGAFGGFLIVFGVGLGHHIALLAEELDFKTLIVVEPHEELIRHSFHVMDWCGFREGLEAKGRNLLFVHGDGLFQKLLHATRTQYYPYLDGSYLFFHSHGPELAELGRQLTEKAHFLTMSLGWVEDQILLLQNNLDNFARPGFYLQKSKVSSARTKPVIVVGAGPSVDRCFDVIRRNRENAVVISASSSLSALLKNGITPDIHCALENGANLTMVIEELSREHDLSDVTLYASATVDPGLAPYFKRAVFFFRDHLASTAFLGGDAERTIYGEPTTGNVALYCALSLGFREIYLFGLDFGSHVPAKHHSQYSVEFTHKDYKRAAYTPFTFEKTVLGNFGGELMSGWLLDWGRAMANDAIRSMPNANVRNCSNGAIIPSAPAMPPQHLFIGATPGAQDEDIDRAASALTFCAEGWTDREGMAQLASRCSAFVEDCLEDLAGHVIGQGSPQTEVVRLCDPITAKLSVLEREAPAAFLILAGDTQTALSAAYHYASKLDPSATTEGLGVIHRTLRESFERVRTLVEDGFKSLADH